MFEDILHDVMQYFPPAIILQSSPSWSLPHIVKLPVQRTKIPFRPPTTNTVEEYLVPHEICLEDLRGIYPRREIGNGMQILWWDRIVLISCNSHLSHTAKGQSRLIAAVD